MSRHGCRLGNKRQRLHGIELAEGACVAFQVHVVATAQEHLHGRVELKGRPVEHAAMLRGDLVIVGCGTKSSVSKQNATNFKRTLKGRPEV